jgi:hypothetical protein
VNRRKIFTGTLILLAVLFLLRVSSTIGQVCCEMDFDCDFDVDGIDAEQFTKGFGRNEFFEPCSNANPCIGDFDCDGGVDGSDASLFKQDFGRNEFNNPYFACKENLCDYPEICSGNCYEIYPNFCPGWEASNCASGKCAFFNFEGSIYQKVKCIGNSPSDNPCDEEYLGGGCCYIGNGWYWPNQHSGNSDGTVKVCCEGVVRNGQICDCEFFGSLISESQINQCCSQKAGLLENGNIHCILEKSDLGEGVCLWNKTEGSFYVYNGYFGSGDTVGYICEDGIKRKKPYICPKGYFGEEMLGRVTSSSAVINMVPCQNNVSVYIEYGTSSGVYDSQTETHIGFIRQALEITLSDLLPDTNYFYRVMEKPSDENYFSPRKEGSFYTERSPGSPFNFVVTADSHYHQVNGIYAEQNPDILKLFEQTFQNIALDNADFHIDLGDSFFTDYGTIRDVFFDIKSQLEGYERYEDLRAQHDKIHHSLPYYFVLGNHEGEFGFHFYDLAQWSQTARKLYVPNPHETTYPEGGSIDENYYAFTWGDALFIILDPFRYTVNYPKFYGLEEWTLGKDQLAWLEGTLENSDSKYKFIFIHHLVGGCGTYGRGGILCAHNGEWGSLIHPMLVQHNVSIVFHGHDHAFVDEILDGIRYTEVPNPYPELPWAGDPAFYNVDDVLHSPGHLLVNVTPISVSVEYIGSSLNADNRDVKYRYEMSN